MLEISDSINNEGDIKKKKILTMCIIKCWGRCYSENPTDFPKIRFPFAKLVARDSQQTIHQTLVATREPTKKRE